LFVVAHNKQFRQVESHLFCIVDSQQMGEHVQTIKRLLQLFVATEHLCHPWRHMVDGMRNRAIRKVTIGVARGGQRGHFPQHFLKV